jgi:hypothetical protein
MNFDQNGASRARIQAKLEEIVRQLWLLRLHEDYNYPLDRLRVEHPIQFGREVKKADIVVINKDRPTIEFIIVEVKKSNSKTARNSFVPISDFEVSLLTSAPAVPFHGFRVSVV